MMAGGLFMLGFGLIAMLLVIGLPVALIAVLIMALTRRGNFSVTTPAPVHQSTVSARTCSHCGVALQADWSHCPQCGVTV
jgi:hypothetical protein